jgi:molybdate transport system substrate-binding protein
VLASLAACAEAPKQPLTIAAAASLAPLFEALGPQLSQQLGSSITFSYASTASLAEQIRNGAPFDVLAAADAVYVDRLIEEGLLDAQSRTVFARGALVLSWPPDAPFAPGSLQDLLDPAFAHVALANPVFAPYGLAGRQALERGGLWMELQPRLIFAGDVRDAGQLVASGNAEAGLLAASTALSLSLPSLEIPQVLFDPIDHVAAGRPEGENYQAALQFLAYLRSAEAASLLERHGLRPADG